MIKAGIFLDIENLVRSGGWGLRFETIKELVRAQGGTIIRANAYIAFDKERESNDFDYRNKKLEYRDAVRKSGFHVVLKEVSRYHGEDGEVVLKADADLDLAVDALLQSENLDYILLGSGDGDFLHLVRALQGRGKRVDVLSFSNTNHQLRQEADYYFNGYLFPNILPISRRAQENRLWGFMHNVLEDQGYGFLTVQNSLRSDDINQNIFLHIKNIQDSMGNPLSNGQFADLKDKQDIIEFDLIEEQNRYFAKNAVVLDDVILIGKK